MANKPIETFLKQQDCANCHTDDHTNTGPSYNKIANRYIHYTQDTVTMLANRIIKGSVGNWGQIPMTHHPTLCQIDAEKLVLFILQKVK